MLREITCNRTRKLIAIKEKVSLYSNQITFSYNQWLHLGSSQYKQFPQKKRKKRTEGVCAEEKEKGRMIRGRKEERKKRDNERKEKEMKEVKKRRRRKGMERATERPI